MGLLRFLKSGYGVISILVTLSGIATLPSSLETIGRWLTGVPIILQVAVPLYWLILLGLVIGVLGYFRVEKSTPSSILDVPDARQIVLLCEECQDAETLREEYDDWQDERNVTVVGGMTFADVLKALEKEGHIERDVWGKWCAKEKSIETIKQYYGES